MPPSSQTSLSTPTRGPVQPPVTESPGAWQHPKMQEIIKRRNKTNFTERNIRSISFNLAAIGLLVVLNTLLRQYGPKGVVPTSWRLATAWTYRAFILIPVINIAISLLPLIRPKDDLNDIALTAGQRKLLGLPPSSAPPTPGSVYSTPPRYSRTPSISGSAGSSRSYSSSPIGGAVGGSGSATKRLSGGGGSPFSPAAGSPLLQKAFNGARRSSLGSGSPLNGSTGPGLLGVGPESPTPNPVNGKRSSVALNNKWLYERGRRTSGTGRLYS